MYAGNNNYDQAPSALTKFGKVYAGVPDPDVVPVELKMGFVGSILLKKKSLYLNWHKVLMDLFDVSSVLVVFRQIPESMSPINKFFFFAWVSSKRPLLLHWPNIRKSLQNLFVN